MGDQMSPAMATVATRSLRVRQAPGENSEMIAGVKEKESYKVIGISSDGAWVQLEIPAAPEGVGWVSANFVTVTGDITEVAIVQMPANAEAPPSSNESPQVLPTPAPGYVVVSADGTPLRVRSAPTAEEDNKVGNVFDGETYRILVRIDVPQLGLENGGWVAAEFVIIGE
jgi:hypothetical protein